VVLDASRCTCLYMAEPGRYRRTGVVRFSRTAKGGRFVQVSAPSNHARRSEALPISPVVWDRLVEANQRSVLAGWAADGAFATGIGADYHRGCVGSLLYVGKSAGPLGSMVGSCSNQAERGRASSQRMFDRQNIREGHSR